MYMNVHIKKYIYIYIYIHKQKRERVLSMLHRRMYFKTFGRERQITATNNEADTSRT